MIGWTLYLIFNINLSKSSNTKRMIFSNLIPCYLIIRRPQFADRHLRQITFRNRTPFAPHTNAQVRCANMHSSVYKWHVTWIIIFLSKMYLLLALRLGLSDQFGPNFHPQFSQPTEQQLTVLKLYVWSGQAHRQVVQFRVQTKVHEQQPQLLRWPREDCNKCEISAT